MTAPAMGFLLTVSLVTAAAAWMAEAGLRRLGLSTRWVWLMALAAGPVLLFGGWLGPAAASSPSGSALGVVAVVELPGFTVGGGGGTGWPAAVEMALAALWAGASLLLLTALVRAHAGLMRERTGWPRERVLDRDVLVAPDRGPAVAGLATAWMVLPRWALALPEEELRLVLAHEEEHLRAGDPRTLAAGLALLLLAAWNPVAWWQLRRLRTAMEVDCDRRVLARHPDRRTYGASLLAVAARASGPSLALAAFSERSTSLEERIRTMTRAHSRWTKPAGALLVALGVLVGVQACGVDQPAAPDAPATDAPAPAADASSAAEPTPPAAADSQPPPAAPPTAEPSPNVVEVPGMEPTPPPPEVAPEPTFTPFTVAPSIQNRREVVEAMGAEYPPLLREAGIEGTVRVYFFIGADGLVKSVRMDQTSGHEALDQAALRVAEVYRFSPALNGDEPVPVWVSFPITFQAGGP